MHLLLSTLIAASLLTVACDSKPSERPPPPNPPAQADTAPGAPSTPTAPLSRYDGLSVGVSTTCATHQGEVTCWGAPLGPPIEDAAPPSPIALSDGVELSVGYQHACARLTSGDLRCWGQGPKGELGVGKTGVNSAQPVAVRGLQEAQSIHAGSRASCARSQGQIWCWGALGSHASGTGIPEALPELEGASAIALGEHLLCAINAGAVSCLALDRQDPPFSVPGVTQATAVAVELAGALGCALDTTGKATCWAPSADGQPGTVQLPEALPPLAQIAPGTPMCAITRDEGALLCWGEGEKPDEVTRFDELASGVSHVGVGVHERCALKAGALWCWKRGEKPKRR